MQLGHLGGITCLALLVEYGLMCFVRFRHVREHQNVLHSSPLLKKTSVRRVVLDKWFPLIVITSGNTI